MQATGIIRRIDDLGRIVIPREIRRQLKIEDGEPFEIFIDKDNHNLIFHKYRDNPLNQAIALFNNLNEQDQCILLEYIQDHWNE